VIRNLDWNSQWWNASGPGQWNDPDMLEIGNGLSNVEEISHFSLWALMKAPLIIGADLTSLSASAYKTLTNAEVIAINQDPLGIQGKIVVNGSNYQIYADPLYDGSLAVIAFNRDDNLSMTIKVNWEEIGLKPSTSALVRDLWMHQDIGNFTIGFTTAQTDPHGSHTYKITPLGRKGSKKIVKRGKTEEGSERRNF